VGWIRLIFVQPTHEQMNQNVADNLNPKTIHKKRFPIEIAHWGDFLLNFKDPPSAIEDQAKSIINPPKPRSSCSDELAVIP